MAKVLLGVTGSVAAIRTPELYAVLRQTGHEVRIVATRMATHFFDPSAIDPINPARPERNRDIVYLDDDEWPNERWQRDDPVLHIELRRWADLFVIAPLDANTLAKLAVGLCDNCLTCVWRAWDTTRPVVLAPAMNTLMWDHPLTSQHLRQLAALTGIGAPPADLGRDDLIAWMNRSPSNLRIVPPQSKRLACGDVGPGAMAAIADITTAVATILRPDT